MSWLVRSIVGYRRAPGRTFAFAFIAAVLSGACGDEGSGGISENAACDAYSDKLVECLAEQPQQEDDIKIQATTSCKDALGEYADLNPENDECVQATRRYFDCFGREPSCADLATAEMTQDYGQICRSEYFDIVDYCEYLPGN